MIMTRSPEWCQTLKWAALSQTGCHGSNGRASFSSSSYSLALDFLKVTSEVCKSLEGDSYNQMDALQKVSLQVTYF